jgi:hypothetical protein
MEGEALSSWIRRIASTYEMTLVQLLEHGLGQDPKIETDLDLDPPPGVLDALAKRTGVTLDRAVEMCLAGWTPWLLDSLQPQADGFETYTRQLSVMLKPGRRSKHRAGDWVAWRSADPVRRACPGCVEDPHRRGLRLIWQLPLTLSCPEHGVMLEPFIGFPGEYLAWTHDAGPRDATDTVQAMDRRTEQALRTGHVELPGRTVHAGMWFRLLRTLLDEVSTPATYWQSRARDLTQIWERSGHPVRAGAGLWRPYEAFPWTVQAQLLEAASCAIELLEAGELRGRGTHAGLFFPVHEPVNDGRPTHATPEMVYVRRWKQATTALEDLIGRARTDPGQAQALFDFLAAPHHTTASCERARATLHALGIPAPPESRKQADPPVTVT